MQSGLTIPVCVAIVVVGAMPCGLLALWRWHRMRSYRRGQRA